MRILFADSVDESSLSPLTAAGHDVEVRPALGADDLPDAIDDVDVLVVRSTKVTAKTIESAAHLGLIVRAGAGTDNIDKATASARGVYVSNVPGRNAIAVAELTMGLLLAIDRHIADGVADLRSGQWNKARYTAADGLFGRTLAIIGLGDIGLAVAERAKAFGLTVVSMRKTNRSSAVTQRIRSIGIQLVDTHAELLAKADVVSVHVPSSASTVGMIDSEFLALLPDGAIVLNTSRGNIVDEDALLDALNNRGFRAGLDVYPGEPAAAKADFNSALASHPGVVGSHHIGASTKQAQQSVAAGTIDVIEKYLAGDIINCVNLAEEEPGGFILSIRHINVVGVLAKVFSELRHRGFNILQVKNQVFTANGAAIATINVHGDPCADLREAMEAIEEVLSIRISDF